MASKQPNLLWRVREPKYTDMTDTVQLQTLADVSGNRPKWITVAHGSKECMTLIAKQLSDSRYRMFPFVPTLKESGALEAVTRRVGERKPPKRIENPKARPASIT